MSIINVWLYFVLDLFKLQIEAFIYGQPDWLTECLSGWLTCPHNAFEKFTFAADPIRNLSPGSGFKLQLGYGLVICMYIYSISCKRTHMYNVHGTS